MSSVLMIWVIVNHIRLERIHYPFIIRLCWNISVLWYDYADVAIDIQDRAISMKLSCSLNVAKTLSEPLPGKNCKEKL